MPICSEGQTPNNQRETKTILNCFSPDWIWLVRAHIETRYCCNRCDGLTQGRREPRMGPGTAQILRISGFVQSKTGKENGTLFSGFSSDLQNKKRSSPKLKRFFCPNSGDLQTEKKGLRCFISMGPIKPIGPSHGPLQAHWSPKDPWAPGSLSPLPPSRRPWSDLWPKSSQPKKEEKTTNLTELKQLPVQKSTVLTNLWFKFKITILCTFLNKNTT